MFLNVKNKKKPVPFRFFVSFYFSFLAVLSGMKPFQNGGLKWVFLPIGALLSKMGFVEKLRQYISFARGCFLWPPNSRPCRAMFSSTSSLKRVAFSFVENHRQSHRFTPEASGGEGGQEWEKA